MQRTEMTPRRDSAHRYRRGLPDEQGPRGRGPWGVWAHRVTGETHLVHRFPTWALAQAYAAWHRLRMDPEELTGFTVGEAELSSGRPDSPHRGEHILDAKAGYPKLRAKIHAWMLAYQRRTGRRPSMRDFREESGVCEKTVSKVLRLLWESGRVVYHPGHGRNWEAVEAGQKGEVG